MPKPKAPKKSPPGPVCIRLRNVRQNNLKGFDLDLPHGKLVVVTGLSGSGKSSLAFETLYAEGYFNGGGHPLHKGDVWRRAIVGGTGRYMGARGEDVVRYNGDWVYFTLTMYLP